MSEAAREWRFYIDDMIAFGEKVLAYTAGLDQQGFIANTLVYDATLRNLELIGEAALTFQATCGRLAPACLGAWSLPRATASSMPTSASTTTRFGASW